MLKQRKRREYEIRKKQFGISEVSPMTVQTVHDWGGLVEHTSFSLKWDSKKAMDDDLKCRNKLTKQQTTKKLEKARKLKS